MGNHTVNGKKIGKAAGLGDKVSIGYVCTHQNGKKLEIDNSVLKIYIIEKEDIANENQEYVAIKALPGGNPNREQISMEK